MPFYFLAKTCLCIPKCLTLGIFWGADGVKFRFCVFTLGDE